MTFRAGTHQLDPVIHHDTIGIGILHRINVDHVIRCQRLNKRGPTARSRGGCQRGTGNQRQIANRRDEDPRNLLVRDGSGEGYLCYPLITHPWISRVASWFLREYHQWTVTDRIPVRISLWWMYQQRSISVGRCSPHWPHPHCRMTGILSRRNNLFTTRHRYPARGWILTVWNSTVFDELQHVGGFLVVMRKHNIAGRADITKPYRTETFLYQCRY